MHRLFSAAIIVLAIASIAWWANKPAGFGAWGLKSGGEPVWLAQALLMPKDACEAWPGPARFTLTAAVPVTAATCEPVSNGVYYSNVAVDRAVQVVNSMRGRPRCTGTPMCLTH